MSAVLNSREFLSSTEQLPGIITMFISLSWTNCQESGNHACINFFFLLPFSCFPSRTIRASLYFLLPYSPQPLSSLYLLNQDILPSKFWGGKGEKVSPFPNPAICCGFVLFCFLIQIHSLCPSVEIPSPALSPVPTKEPPSCLRVKKFKIATCFLSLCCAFLFLGREGTGICCPACVTGRGHPPGQQIWGVIVVLNFPRAAAIFPALLSPVTGKLSLVVSKSDSSCSQRSRK